MKIRRMLTVPAVLFGACVTPPSEETGMKKLTPILLVETIEPSLGFWVDGLGSEVTTEVPHEDGLGFVILQHGAIEVMLQSKASALAGDATMAVELSKGLTCLFIEVGDFDRTPGGHIVGLAQMDTAKKPAGS